MKKDEFKTLAFILIICTGTIFLFTGCNSNSEVKSIDDLKELVKSGEINNSEYNSCIDEVELYPYLDRAFMTGCKARLYNELGYNSDIDFKTECEKELSEKISHEVRLTEQDCLELLK